jgi:DNA-binding beta-propeller fold protein YncE
MFRSTIAFFFLCLSITGGISCKKNTQTETDTQVTEIRSESGTPICTGIVTTLAGGSATGYVNGTGPAARFSRPIGVSWYGSGKLLIADEVNNVIRMVTTEGVVTTHAGVGPPVLSGYADGPLLIARFNSPYSVISNGTSATYVVDQLMTTVRTIRDGILSLGAGTGWEGYRDGPASIASFFLLSDVAYDKMTGRLILADMGNCCIRTLSPDGIVRTLVGSGYEHRGYADGPVATAKLSTVQGVAVDAVGNIFFCDVGNYRIRKITPAGIVSTYAGSGIFGNVDDKLLKAQFRCPTRIAIDGSGNLYVTDVLAHNVRRIGIDGYVTTLTGYKNGFADGSLETALFSGPRGIAVNNAGNTIYVADGENNRIRKISLGVCP